MLVRGGNSVSQMGESVFLWRLRSPSHLNQLFCNLHDSWIEFSAFLKRHLLKRRTTVLLSDLLSRTNAGVEPTDLSRTYLRQTSHHLFAYFKIDRFDELSSTEIWRLPRRLRGRLRFFYINGVSAHMKPMIPLTAKPQLFETALPNVCFQCIMGIA